MATVKPGGGKPRGARPKRPASHRLGLRRWLMRAGAFVLLVGLVALALGWEPFRANARLAASYGARVGCSCHYVGGRPLGDCRRDFEAGMGLVWLREDAANKTITARYALLFPQSARWRPGPGCVLEKWTD